MSVPSFLKSESGAVTVDWVVLTAAIVGLGLAVMTVVTTGVADLSDDTATEIASLDPGSMYDWMGSTAMVNSGWGSLSIFSPRQSQAGAESYAASVLAGHNGDYQAAYDQLYQQAQNMTYADGESVDDFGAFEAMAAANNVSLQTGNNLTYAEMHARYEANGTIN
ncbi:hypothetical protein HKCCE2091_12785 [Rhodobacterales bacterium HKCCE2091]|nr:hypothetical protein [Rhodobacterales bacterium HKCCE2091]